MINRHRTLLRIVELEQGKVSKLRLFKLAFLLSKAETEAPSSVLYEFLPYSFPFLDHSASRRLCFRESLIVGSWLLPDYI
jgi:hypothetical protein